MTAEPGDNYLVNSNLPFESDYYCVCIDTKLRGKLPGATDDKIVIITLIRVVSNENKDSILGITQGPDETEGLTIKDRLFKEAFKTLDALDRDRLMRSLGFGTGSNTRG